MISRLADHPVFRRFTQEREEAERFRAEHPELDRAWGEALEINDAINGERWMEERKREIALNLPEAMRRAGVPTRCAEALGKPSETASMRFVRGFTDGPRTFLLLLGGAGVGKSVAAAWAVSQRLQEELRHRPTQRCRDSRFVRACDLAKFSLYDTDDQAEFRRFQWVDLLVLDDLGTEQASSSWLSQLDELIDHRYGERLKTILTSNLDAEHFSERYGERISDRIRHDGSIVGAGTETLRKRGEG